MFGLSVQLPLQVSRPTTCASVHGVSAFVQATLNRFTNVPGLFESAREAGKSTFTGEAATVRRLARLCGS